MRAWLKNITRATSANTIEANLRTWSEWDWTSRGEEWTPSAAWKASFLKNVLEPCVPVGSRVLEIGPGGGRWTERLLDRACQVTAVDLTPACIGVCEARFGSRANARFVLNDGCDLGFLPGESIDRVWSFDVFVHMSSVDVEGYVRQLPRILAPGGRGMLHHSRRGVHVPSWRSDLTAERMRTMCERHSLAVECQFNTWDEGRASLYGGAEGPDVITVFRKR